MLNKKNKESERNKNLVEGKKNFESIDDEARAVAISKNVRLKKAPFEGFLSFYRRRSGENWINCLALSVREREKMSRLITYNETS